jgi:hypothetical protein
MHHDYKAIREYAITHLGVDLPDSGAASDT